MGREIIKNKKAVGFVYYAFYTALMLLIAFNPGPFSFLRVLEMPNAIGWWLVVIFAVLAFIYGWLCSKYNPAEHIKLDPCLVSMFIWGGIAVFVVLGVAMGLVKSVNYGSTLDICLTLSFLLIIPLLSLFYDFLVGVEELD